MAEMLEIVQANAGKRSIGPRGMVVDCSSFSMPDTPAVHLENAELFAVTLAGK